MRPLIILWVGLALFLPVNRTPAAETLANSRTEFLKLLDRPRVELAPEVKPPAGTNGFRAVPFSFASEADVRVPGLLMKRGEATGRRPVVIVLHGTGANKESQLPLLHDLAKRGFLAVAIDGRHHGARTKAGIGSIEYHEAILNAWFGSKKLPFLYDTAWDVMRLVDYLGTRDDVDAARIGLIGFSKGGMEGYLAAAADPRIAVVVPCIGVQSFRWALDNESWRSRVDTFKPAIDAAAKDEGEVVNAAFVRRFYDRVAPGIYGQFDGPAMVPLIAPRPLLVINGDTDPRTPMPGVNECLTAARAAYRAADAEPKLQVILQPQTGHKVTVEARQAAIDWFEKWLRP
ncbi:MAG: alpha/beta fold hydrolase [Proteobacteria bacterium]|nr:alpha/beta fold hydrolase [Pseudomonadota bacterium]